VPSGEQRRRRTATRRRAPELVGRARTGRERGEEGGPASLLGEKRGRGPKPKENHFSFPFSNSKFCYSPKFKFLELKMAFLRFDLKTKVVQNLILYNIALGHILKFQIDFKMEIQSSF
jgi:hypothetical protein